MKLKIGENIKRLRRSHNITQEQLAEILNVSCAAVSKWETGDTYPDITLIFPLSHYFGISVDELMGYDALIIENEISQLLKKYFKLQQDFKHKEASDLICEARKKYPQDYKIMHQHMFDIIGGLADNNNVIVKNKSMELEKICNRILDGCNDERIRLDAITIKAKVLHAKNQTEEALELLNTFPTFYHSSGQRIEQLYAKNTDEFYHQLKINMYELADFMANKLAKSIFYDKSLTKEEKMLKIIKSGEFLSHFNSDNDFDVFVVMSNMFWGESLNKATQFDFNDSFIIRCCKQKYDSVKNLTELIIQDRFIKEYIQNTKCIKIKNNYLLDVISHYEKLISENIINSQDYKDMVKRYKNII